MLGLTAMVWIRPWVIFSRALSGPPRKNLVLQPDAAQPAQDDANEASELVDINHAIPTLNDCVFNFH